MFLNTSIKNASTSARILIVCVTLALLIGYAVALLKLYSKTQFNLNQTVLNYRGSPDESLMMFPKNYQDILQTTHSHALSVPLVYFVLGLLLLATSLKDQTKSFLILGLFMSYFVEYISLWGLWGISEKFIFLVALASLWGGLCYVTSCLILLKECIVPQK